MSKYFSGYCEAMEAAGAEVLAYEEFGSYQGDWWAKVGYQGREYWVHGTFGSCSGCDAFQSEFEFDNPERCESHTYWDVVDIPDDCEACEVAKKNREENLIEFGKGYLLGNEYTQREAILASQDNADWDDNAPRILSFLQENKLEEA